MKKLSVIIVSFNTKRLLKNCLVSLFNSLEFAKISPQTEIIVVDNASSDGSLAMLKSDFPKIKLIKNSRNKGFGQANNQGIANSQGDFILLLNSDTSLYPKTLIKTIPILETQKKIGVLGCKLLNRSGSIQQSVGYFPTLLRVFLWMFFIDDLPFIQKLIKPYHLTDTGSYDSQLEVDWVTGAFMLIRREALDLNNLFDPNVFMYTEEVDLCYRLKKQSWQIIYSPEASLIHEKGSSGIGSDSGILEEFYGIEYLSKKYFNKFTVLWFKLFITLGALLRYIVFGIIRNSEKRRKIYLQYLKLAR